MPPKTIGNANRTTLGRFDILEDADLQVALFKIQSNVRLCGSFNSSVIDLDLIVDLVRRVGRRGRSQPQAYSNDTTKEWARVPDGQSPSHIYPRENPPTRLWRTTVSPRSSSTSPPTESLTPKTKP